MLVTARCLTTGTAVVGTARSRDCEQWEVGPPLTPPSTRFAWSEVVSVQSVEGRWVLVFSCLAEQMPGAAPGAGGVWSLPVPDPDSWGDAPAFDLDDAVRLTNERLYVGKLVQLLNGGWGFLAFVNLDGQGEFSGGVIDPCDVRWRDDGRGLELVDPPHPWLPDDGRVS
jgi:beta-fructofuranosidase